MDRFRLTDGTRSLGLSCGREGLQLAGVSLLRKSAAGLEPRSANELGILLRAAYGVEFQASNLSRGLGIAAEALNRGDLSRAMIAALHLRLPELNLEGAARMAEVDEVLAKYSPDQPRDWHGRWTTGDSAPEAPPTRPTPTAAASNDNPQRPRSRLLVPVRYQAEGGEEPPPEPAPGGYGDNGPPPDPEPEPALGAPKVPEGWDIPGATVGGVYYRPIRIPKLRDGTPWPTPTPDLVRATLRPTPGTRPPSMLLYAPEDRIGPVLVGSTATQEYAEPPGYDTVRLVGTPQVTRSSGSETGHAQDSVEEALRLAETNQFSTIYFNRSFSMITSRMVQSLIRPDVVAVVRPHLDVFEIYHPYESLSPGQTLEERQDDMPDVPGIRPLDGRRYKRFGIMRSPYFRYIGAGAAKGPV